MLEKNICISNKLGLHARASMLLINTAGRFNSSIKIISNSQTVDAKDILSVMSLAASQGTSITIQVSGDDETAALEAITQLIDNKFGEDE